MLSVLIPTYNYDITRLVKSISVQLEKAGFPYEILVADDGSPLKTIINKNKSVEWLPNCTMFLGISNKGRTLIRHFLAEKAQYDRLLFMDADVLPESDLFIEKFDLKNTNTDIVFGGISYEENPAEKDKMLRWKYGRSREAKPVSEREKKPYLSIISQCFLIKKEVFLKANNFFENVYGVDVLFAQNLEKLNVKVLHIDNPIVHLGLENSVSFIEKTKKGLDSLYYFEKGKMISNDYRPIQKMRNTLKKCRMTGIFKLFMQMFGKMIEKNLLSANPSLFLFDVYRLYYFINLK